MSAVVIKYEKEFTDGPKHTWERTATIDGKRLWEEKWCKDCDGWRRVKWFYGERLCIVCFEADEQLADELLSSAEDVVLIDTTRELKPVQCACGMLGESYTEPWRCDKCEALVQETESELRRV